MDACMNERYVYCTAVVDPGQLPSALIDHLAHGYLHYLPESIVHDCIATFSYWDWERASDRPSYDPMSICADQAAVIF